MKYLTIILILLTITLKAQVFKVVSPSEKSDFTISMLEDSTKADMIIFLTKDRRAAKTNECYWKITRGKRYDYTYNVVHHTDKHDFKVYITNNHRLVGIRSEFLKVGLEKWKD